ncbi:MAG: hypothetical protein FWC28_06320 [Proteobacteria bacterium]|nr:hypothetical protein [Cystobacterineae bacterium]MCL2258846.1 hypothetical protein [Cystobacterineae bacterium]MCL2314848.1 hypothetical protein [Pseudomonadota bacterium]
MPKAILLVTDHLQVIDAFKRIARAHALDVEVVSHVSDAVMAFVQSMHERVFLSPGLEGGRGMQLIEELASLSPHIVLLGEPREGFAHLELPLVESKVLACLGRERPARQKPEGVAKGKVRKPVEIYVFPKEKCQKPPMGVAADAAERPPQVSQKVVAQEVAAEEAITFVSPEFVHEVSASSPEVEEGLASKEAGEWRAKTMELSKQVALVSEERAQAEDKLLRMEKTLFEVEGKLQLHRRIHGKLEAELAKNNAELMRLKAEKGTALQAEQELHSQRTFFQREREHAQEETQKMELLLERALEERECWQEDKATLNAEIQQLKAKLEQAEAALVQEREEKDIACLKLAEVQEKWKESDARLQAATSLAAMAQAEIDALKACAEQTRVEFEKKGAEFEQQALSFQQRMAKMEEELLQLRSQAAKSEAEVRAAMALAPATVILPLSSPMPGNVFSTLEECLRLLVQTVAVRPWLCLDIESRLGRRKLYICQGALVGVDTQCQGDLLLRQARRDGLISSKQYQNLRLLEERSPREQLEILLQKGFIREVEAEGLLQRYAERVVYEAMSQGEAAFALVEEKPEAEVTVLKKPQPFWPLLKEGLGARHTEARFLERFGGKEAIPSLKTNLAGLVAMGMSKREKRFFESMDAESRLGELTEGLGLQPKQIFSILLAAWKLEVIEFSEKTCVHAGVSEVSTERLFVRFEEIREADYFNVLGVSQEANTCEIEDARMRLMEEFNPLKFAGHKNPQVFACAKQLAALVEEAFLVLENESQRKEYAHHLMGNG